MSKIAMLSIIDYAGSGFRMMSAIKRHTDHSIALFSGPPENKYNHPTYIIVTDINRSLVYEELNRADILHFKGDWPPEDGYLGMQIPKDKPIIITTSGTFFRKKIHKGFERFGNGDYDRATLKTSFTADLLYPEYSDIWTPHVIDSENKPVLWEKTDCPMFLHVPSTPIRKGTGFVEEVFRILRSKIKCETKIVTDVDYLTARELKKTATMYFDQFEVGFYGNSALEAMQYGIPVVAWIAPWAIDQAKGKLDDCPVINRSQASAERTAIKVIELMDDEKLSQRTKEWCNKTHGYSAIAKLWDNLYKSLC